ncbi:plasmid stabilization protein [Streptomyces kronopolitis]|uniref:plasmid stabilization protein n=1 Tax=Streptomyces kronopolitis TaxID=1612435 RepID=UPI00343D26ED
MPAGSSRKRSSPKRAKEIAARTVNKERARSGEAKTAGKASTRDPKSASQRGGERSHRGASGPTRDQLYQEAKRKNIDGRSTMNKAQLRRAVGR